MNNIRGRLSFISFILCLFFISCVGTAKVKDFPKSANDIDFSKYSTEMNNNKTPFWTLETSNEYYIEQPKTIDENKLVNIIETALQDKGYVVKSKDIEKRCIIGKRGLRFNEWGSVTGVYYKMTNDKFQIYINTKITQDATGGVRNNLAKKIGVLIETSLK